MEERNWGSGLLLGTVVEQGDDGTVKVRLARGEGNGKNFLEKVKVLAPLAGEGYGAFCLPEIGDQVVVAFLDGCYSRPLVLGSLYVAGDGMLSQSVKEKNVLKRFRTKRGTLVELDDTQDEEAITLRTPRTLSVTFKEKDKTVKVDAGKASITLDGDKGKVAIQAETELSLKAGEVTLTLKSQGGKLSAEGTAMTMKGKTIKVESGGSLTLKGEKAGLSGTTVSVEASGPLVLKGAVAKIN